jgi:hypothetical protein
MPDQQPEQPPVVQQEPTVYEMRTFLHEHHGTVIQYSPVKGPGKLYFKTELMASYGELTRQYLVPLAADTLDAAFELVPVMKRRVQYAFMKEIQRLTAGEKRVLTLNDLPAGFDVRKLAGGPG